MIRRAPRRSTLLSALALAGLLLASTLAGAAPAEPCRVLARLPHGRDAYTQGLLFHGPELIETTGLYGASTIRVLDPASGRILRQVALPREVFGEGAALLGERLYVLTWRSGRVLVFDANSLSPRAELRLGGEGWGLTTDGRRLLASDGSHRLTWLDPASLAPLGQIEVTDNGAPVSRLNELEWVDGLILANVWQTSKIAVIDPGTGRVLSWLDCTALAAGQGFGPDDVLNGIAFDPGARRLYITGKRWPVLYVIELPGRTP
jgi:glutamine cyclotransferase